MVKSAIADYTEMIRLSGISWQTYEALCEELRDHRVRLTFNRGDLELMAPSPEHELSKKLMGRFVETLAEEYQRSIYPLGATTLRQPELVGLSQMRVFICAILRQSVEKHASILSKIRLLIWFWKLI